MSVVVVDDHLLLRVLLGDEPPTLRADGESLATTGLWYHRLSRALGDEAVVGSLSRRLGSLDRSTAAAVVGTVIELPDTIRLVSLRSLAWPMGQLVHSGVRLNLLSLEALAAAQHLSGEICLAEADDNPTLRAACNATGVTVRIIPD